MRADGVEGGVHLLLARLRDGREVADGVGGLVQLLGDQPLAVVHVQVVLHRVGPVAVDAGGVAAPARVACGDALEVERLVEGRRSEDVVGNVWPVLPKVRLAREDEVVLGEVGEGLVEGGQRVSVGLGLRRVIPLAGDHLAALEALGRALARQEGSAGAGGRLEVQHVRHLVPRVGVDVRALVVQLKVAHFRIEAE